MPNPTIEATPVVNGGGPPPVKNLGSPAIIPEGESAPLDGDGKPAADADAGKDASKSGDTSSEDAGGAGKDAAGGGESEAGPAGGETEGDKKADSEPTEEEKAAAAKAKEQENLTVQQRKMFLKLQTEESELTKAQKKLKDDQKSLGIQAETLKGKVDAYDNATRLAKEDPIKLIEALGLTYEQLSAAVLSGKKGLPPEVASLTKQVEELNAQKTADAEEKTKAEATAAADQQKANVKAYWDRLRAAVDSTPEFELLRLQGDAAIKQAIDGAALYYQKHKVLPNDQELLAATESHLEEQAKAAAGTDKLKKLFAPVESQSDDAGDSGDSEEEKPKEEAAGSKEAKPAGSKKTLTNDMQGEGSTRKGSGLKDRDQSVSEAADLLKWSSQ